MTDIEVKKLKKGDKVIHIKWGLGTVLRNDNSHFVAVEYDKEMRGHTCDGLGKNECCWYTTPSEIKLANFTKEDFKDGDIITLRNGDRLIYSDDGFLDLSDDNSNSIDVPSDFYEDLRFYSEEDSYNDIMKVERPVEYITLFDRKDEVKEMTVDEISEKLGFKVKVVGNE